MIKTILTLWLLYCTLLMQAQSFFGLRGGVNIAHVPTTQKTGITKERIACPTADLYFDISVNDKIAIRPEFNFVQKGFVQVQQNDRFYYVFRLNYLEWNVLFKYRMLNINQSQKPKKRINAYLLAGPYYGWAISGKRTNRNFGDPTQLRTEDFLFLRRHDAGLLGGGGVEIPLGVGNLILDLRYNFGLFHIEQFAFTEESMQNHGIIVSTGYAFRLGR
jgi:hypothetical protein